MLRALPLLVLALPSCACVRDTGSCADLASYEPVRAEREATLAFGAGDKRLLGVRGYTTFAPGLGPGPLDAELSGRPLRIIEGTSDFPLTQGCERLNDRAFRYAVRYNRRIMALVRGRF